MEQVEKEVLQVLYDHRGKKSMSPGMVRAFLAHNHKLIYKIKETEYALSNLQELNLVRSKRKPAIKGHWSVPEHDVYDINLIGLKCVENNFVIEPEETTSYSSAPVFINSQVIFGNYTNLEINVFELISELNIDMSQKNEIMNIFNNIEQEIKKDTVDKNKLKEHLKKIADKGFSKLAEAAVSVIMKELIG